MEEKKKLNGLVICTLAGALCGLVANFVTKRLLSGGPSKQKKRVVRHYMTLDWESLEPDQQRIELLLALMDHPGLLFGWRDPSLRSTLRVQDGTIPEYTKEYLICLQQRLLWVVTSNVKARGNSYAAYNHALSTSYAKFMSTLASEKQKSSFEVQNHVFQLSQLIPRLPKAIIKEPVAEYTSQDWFIPMPIQPEPDNDFTVQFLATPAGREQLTLYNDILTKKQAMRLKIRETAQQSQPGLQDDNLVNFRDTFKMEEQFYKKTGYSLTEFNSNLSRMLITDESFRRFFREAIVEGRP